MSVNLSYIIATRNRLPFLKIILDKLTNELNEDEEIVVVDGNSTDGAKQYLQQLFDDGKIQQFISEPDRNQAHGWNKALLMAKGTLIKKIIDDDVFCYAAIRECKNYMLQNPSVDVVISNDLSGALYDQSNIEKHSRLHQFEQWSAGLVPSFTFGDVHMLIKKNALARVGLYNPAYIMMDWEYSLRISYLQANITFYTGYNALSVGHSKTVSSLRDQKLTEEQGLRGNVFYEYAGDGADISLWSKIKIYIGTKLYHKKAQRNTENSNVDMNSVYNYYYDYLNEFNNSLNPQFIEKN